MEARNVFADLYIPGPWQDKGIRHPSQQAIMIPHGTRARYCSGKSARTHCRRHVEYTPLYCILFRTPSYPVLSASTADGTNARTRSGDVHRLSLNLYKLYLAQPCRRRSEPPPVRIIGPLVLRGKEEVRQVSV